jgi:hypothetical protein
MHPLPALPLNPVLFPLVLVLALASLPALLPLLEVEVDTADDPESLGKTSCHLFDMSADI